MIFCLRKNIFIAAFLVVPQVIFSQSQKNSPVARYKVITGEKGYYPFTNYSSKTYQAAPQNWSLLQDKRGMIYVANNDGILEYDGVNWRLIKVANETNARSLAMDAAGRIYAGAFAEFGYLEPDAKGSMRYVSLIPRLRREDRDFGDVWCTVAAKDGIYFQSTNKIFRWDGQAIKVWNAEKYFHRIYYAAGRVWVREREVGLLELKDDKMITIKGGELFAQESIDGMVPLSLKSSGPLQILICTRTKGLYLLKEMPSASGTDIAIEKFSTQVDPFLLENLSYHMLKVNGIYSLATVTRGIVHIDAEGSLVNFFNKNVGLPDDAVYFQLQDKAGNLWIATDNGISKVFISSPVTIFSDRNGLGGTVQSIVQHEKTFYAATNLGIFRLKPGYIENGLEFSPASFEKIASVNEPCWSLLSFRSGNYSTLICVANGKIFSLDSQGNKKDILKSSPWTLFRSTSDSNRVFIGLENGIASIYWDGSQWKEEASIHEIREYVTSIAEEQNGTLWLGHTNGVMKLSVKPDAKNARRSMGDYSVTKFDTVAGLPKGIVEVKNMNGEMIFGTTLGIYRTSGTRFFPDSIIGKALTGKARQIHRISPDAFGNIWLETHFPASHKFEFGYLKKEKDGSYSWNITPFLPYSDEVIHSIYHEPSGITWFGGAGGIYRFNRNESAPAAVQYNSVIRKVTIGKDSIIFNGTFYDSSKVSVFAQNASLLPELPFENNSVIFEFSSLDFTNEAFTQHKYFLEGFDTEWSNWKHETKAVYTNLPEGNYIFRVKAKNIFNEESTEAMYEFSILPPWYRTWWAYILYVLASVGFIWGVVTYSSRGLKAIIRERTAEIVKQKEEIEYKNRNITDSINYAKRIQEAILPQYDLMRSRFPESFILYRPKDIVAGDFYWFAEKDGKFIVAACDCTGHGVPGAFMSLIGYSLLNEVILEKTFTDPAHALDSMKRGIIKSLGQTGQEGEQKDGMDMSLVTLEVALNGRKVNQKLAYAGANNPLYLVRKGELMELNADKMPIGIYLGIDKPFSNKEMMLEPGDTFYMFSDGYADQFGGEHGKKFTKKRFKDTLLSIQHEPMHRQKTILENTIDGWLGDQQQIDDILVIGIRV